MESHFTQFAFMKTTTTFQVYFQGLRYDCSNWSEVIDLVRTQVDNLQTFISLVIHSSDGLVMDYQGNPSSFIPDIKVHQWHEADEYDMDEIESNFKSATVTPENPQAATAAPDSYLITETDAKSAAALMNLIDDLKDFGKVSENPEAATAAPADNTENTQASEKVKGKK
ncbi:hypothetical protein EBR96_03670 [bacterium]|nr:hypothetical protein [bacterium]